MGKVFIKMRGLGYVVWQTRHMFYHVLIGLVWAWFLRERWHEFNPKWIWTAAIGSVFPDIDHFQYFFTYGRNDRYTKEIFSLIKHRHWRMLFYFVATGHKLNTNLSYHNIYVVIMLIAGSIAASFFDWRFGVVLFGAMVSHYLFDMSDDLVQLGTVNPNWKRWGRQKKRKG
jgi:hypothetical protein